MQKIKDVILFILFLVYVVSVFFIRNYYILGLMILFNVVMMRFVKIGFTSALKNLITLGAFILFTVIVSIIYVDLNEGILSGVRFMLACNTTYIFSKMISAYRFSKVIEIIFIPLKVFRVNPKNIGIMVCIAIAFIPIFRSEVLQILYALKSKGYKLKLRNCNIIFKPLLVSILKRTNDIEASLISKAYQG